MGELAFPEERIFAQGKSIFPAAAGSVTAAGILGTRFSVSAASTSAMHFRMGIFGTVPIERTVLAGRTLAGTDTFQEGTHRQHAGREDDESDDEVFEHGKFSILFPADERLPDGDPGNATFRTWFRSGRSPCR